MQGSNRCDLGGACNGEDAYPRSKALLNYRTRVWFAKAEEDYDRRNGNTSFKLQSRHAQKGNSRFWEDLLVHLWSAQWRNKNLYFLAKA